jgi:hypothetical protein
MRISPPGRGGQESAGDGSESAGAVDSPLVETADGLDGMDRTEIVSALDALSEAARTLADRLR